MWAHILGVNDCQKNFKPFRHRRSQRASQRYIEPFIEPYLWSPFAFQCRIGLKLFSQDCKCPVWGHRHVWDFSELVWCFLHFHWISVWIHRLIIRWTESTPVKIRNGAKLCQMVSCTLVTNLCGGRCKILVFSIYNSPYFISRATKKNVIIKIIIRKI